MLLLLTTTTSTITTPTSICIYIGSSVGQELLDIWSENLKEPVINSPGVYRG